MMKNYRFFIFIFLATVLLYSCKSTSTVTLTQVGQLTLASAKNVDMSKQYSLLSKSAGFDHSQVESLNNPKTRKRTRKKLEDDFNRLNSNKIEDAINNVIESVPGGIYMENAEIYLGKTNGSAEFKFIVAGDVYGLGGKSQNIRGFYVNCRAMYKNSLGIKEMGTVISLVDSKYCLWLQDEAKKPKKLLYDELTKID